MAREMLRGLADAGAEIEVFIASPRTEFLEQLAERPNVRINAFTTRWRWNRWYSSTRSTALLSGTAERVHLGSLIANRLAERHAARPFDVVYRLSQIELLALRRLRRRLPRLVLHPEVHARGELRHHWRERGLASRAESSVFYALNHAYLAYRSLLQRRDVADVACMIAPSQRFADLLAGDYGYPRERIRVLPNVVDLDAFTPALDTPVPSPVRLIYASRMAVRKGVEQIVDLSNRIGDLAGQVMIECVGGPSLFSNYVKLLDGLNPAVARYMGPRPYTALPDLYRSAHACLQPSMYDPFANTVGEAFASGLPVVVSDEVGAGEHVDPRICRRHAAGDAAALEREVRGLVAEVQDGWDPELRAVARRHAEDHLSRERFARELIAVLDGVRLDGDGSYLTGERRGPIALPRQAEQTASR